MLGAIAKRILGILPVLVIVITITFMIARWTPGGPFDGEKNLPPSVEKKLQSYYGMDQPLGKQYLSYLKNIFQGKLGPSVLYQGRQVQEILFPRIPLSLGLGFISVLFACLVGIPMGLFAAYKPNSLQDNTFMALALAGICLPSFVIGPLLILLFGFKLNWFSVMGIHSWEDFILPVLTLALMYIGYIARITRGSMLEVRNQEYMRTAHAKGLSPLKIFFFHGFRNAMTPVLTYIGPTFAAAMSGTLVLETLFNIPGVGRLFIDAIIARDDSLMLGTVIFFALLVLLFNLLVDIALVLFNPKQEI